MTNFIFSPGFETVLPVVTDTFAGVGITHLKDACFVHMTVNVAKVTTKVKPSNLVF